MDKKKKEKNTIKSPSMLDNDGQPKNSFEYVNFYGTYNIQPTQVQENTYPAIGQGLDKETMNRLSKEAERWKKEDSKRPQRPGN